MMMQLCLGVLVLHLVLHQATALPTGASGCAGGRPAVGGTHLTAHMIEQGPLSDQAIQISINGVVLDPNTEFNVPIGVDHVWRVDMPGDGFRGYLLRLDGGDSSLDTTDALSNIPGMGGTVQVAKVCVDKEGVGGVTHTSRALKNTVQGRLRLDDVGENLSLDVTVVLQNRNGLSQFYYTPFVVNAIQTDQETQTDATSTSSPTMTQTDATSTSSPTMTQTHATSTSSPTMMQTHATSMSSSTMAPTLPHLKTRMPTCTHTSSCSVCIGDCDSALDCQGNLACFERDYWDTTPVPGCSGTGVPGKDYCFDPVEYPDTLHLVPRGCNEEAPCQKCQGDCDTDAECAGDLFCYQRWGRSNEMIPGCYGAGYPGKDYCYSRADLNIFGVVITTPGFSALVDLVAEAMLVDTLRGEGPFTVFAPTNAAFRALPHLTLNALVNDVDALTEVLLYHVVSGLVNSSDLVNAGTVTTVIGANVSVTERPLMINNATVITANIPASNGIIHVIDAVLIPPAMFETGVVAVGAVEKELQEGNCTFDSPCSECFGDCDHDGQCASDLECFSRRVEESMPVPGCSGTGHTGWDYCYAADKGALRQRVTSCTPEEPCLKCQGDCDRDEDCAIGLKCSLQSLSDSKQIPGCSGEALGALDYCYDDYEQRRRVLRQHGA